jgi:hypothetical protein
MSMEGLGFGCRHGGGRIYLKHCLFQVSILKAKRNLHTKRK